MAEADAEGDVGQERLRLLHVGGRAGRRVAHVAQPHVADELDHVLQLEHVTHEAAVLVQVQPPALVRRHDA